MEPEGEHRPAISVQHERGRRRYGAVAGDAVHAVLYYDEEEQADGTIVRDLRSTVVDPDHAGEGLGSRLVRRALDDARRDGVKVLSTCWFAAGWIERHPEYEELLCTPTPAGE